MRLLAQVLGHHGRTASGLVSLSVSVFLWHVEASWPPALQ